MYPVVFSVGAAPPLVFHTTDGHVIVRAVPSSIINVKDCPSNNESVGLLFALSVIVWILPRLTNVRSPSVFEPNEVTCSVYPALMVGLVRIGVVNVLLVSVSVVARPTSVSVPVGMVTVPELLIEEITGSVNVLLVNV